MTVAYEQLRSSAVALRRRTTIHATWAIPVALVSGLAVGLESVRFGMRTPSLIDDWFGITYAPRAAHALAHGDYGSSPVDVAGRYRPGYTAIWNYAQWHLLGNPSVATAAVWGALRACAFLVSVGLLTAWVAGQRPGLARPFLWLAPVAVAMTPQFALDLTRHGPADPIMVAGLVLGLALIGVGARALLERDAKSPKRAIAAIAIGYPIYLIGVYSKEASICILAFAPFFIGWIGPEVRARIRGSRVGRYVLPTLMVLLVAPLVHVGVHVAEALSAGDNPYPTAKFSLPTKIFAAGVSPLIGAPGALGTFLWLAGVPAALGLTLTTIRRRETDAWLLTGVLTTGFLMSAFSLVRGDTPSRYYIPWIVAVAAVSVRLLQGTKLGLPVAACVVGAIALTGTRNAVGDWATTERTGSTAVAMAKGVVEANCPLYLANFGVERRLAIPQLLGFVHASRVPKCAMSSKMAYALSWKGAPLPPGFASRCRLGWHKLTGRDGIDMYRCLSLSPSATPDQVSASAEPLTAVVRVLVPKRIPNPRTLFQPASRGP